RPLAHVPAISLTPIHSKKPWAPPMASHASPCILYRFKIHFPILIYDRAFLSLMLLRLQGCGSLPSRIVLRCMLALRLLPERLRVFFPADPALRRSHYD